MKRYSITEVFYTLQGEGAHAGMPALFVRFSGCNMWSGRELDRERDATRTDSRCPIFCDTNFETRARVTATDLAAMSTAPAAVPLIVLTGGEPTLQLDEHLVAALRERHRDAVVAVETNGSRRVPDFIDWICVSPKIGVERLEQRTGDELKVVIPRYDPSSYDSVSSGFDHCWVSAEAEVTGLGESAVVPARLQQAAAWVLENPRWRLTLQAHKILGIP